MLHAQYFWEMKDHYLHWVQFRSSWNMTKRVEAKSQLHKLVFRLKRIPGAGGKHRGSKVCLLPSSRSSFHIFPSLFNQHIHIFSNAILSTGCFIWNKFCSDDFLWKTTYQLRKPGCLSETATHMILWEVLYFRVKESTYHFRWSLH